MAGVVRWTFYDPNTLETYQFEINPNDGGTPQHKKNMQTQNTLAPGGRTLLFEGRDEPITLSWTGTLLSQTQHETFVTWFDKRHQIQLTDDLSRTYWIYITSYAAKRVRAYSHPYKHTYDMQATVLDWP